ncbi:Phage regulatory protein Rha [compost metagenome]
MLPSTEILTMSSRDIADLVGKRHDKVKQSIERLAERSVIDLPPMGEYLDTLGRPASEYRIGKRDSYIVVAQLSPEFTARLVDRWHELEHQTSKRQAAIGYDSPLEFARLIIETMPNLGESTKQVMLSKASELSFGVALLPLPKVEEHLMNATEVGAILGISAQKVGRLANQHGLKTDAHGEVRLDKSKHNNKMVENFFYNQAGVDALRDVMGGDA